MEMSNIDSNLNEGMTWYKMRVTTKTYYTIANTNTKGVASTEGSLVHRVSNHRNYDTANNSHDLANEQTGNCIFTTHHKANER